MLLELGKGDKSLMEFINLWITVNLNQGAWRTVATSGLGQKVRHWRCPTWNTKSQSWASAFSDFFSPRCPFQVRLVERDLEDWLKWSSLAWELFERIRSRRCNKPQSCSCEIGRQLCPHCTSHRAPWALVTSPLVVAKIYVQKPGVQKSDFCAELHH